jgi:hypothetical protein
MYKLNFYVPEKEKESVKQALFDIDVGKYENYDRCSFETLGTGQFRPINGAKPFLGEVDTLKEVDEYKVEMICEDELIKDAIRVLKDAHPYEEVAYEVFKMEKF